MAVISSELHWRGSTGGKKGTSFDKATSTYAAVYRVTTNNPLDQADTIVNYFETSPTLPKLGSEYRYGNDYNPGSICTAIDPDHVDNSRIHWEVILTYTPKDPSSGEDSKDPGGIDANGEPTSDPLQFRNEYEIGRTQISVPCWDAIYLGGFVGTAAAICHAGDRIIPCNSAFVPFNPGLEKEVSLTSLRVTKYRAAYQGILWAQYEDALNSDQISLVGNAYNLQILWDPFTVRLKNIGGSFNLQNGIKFWKISLDLLHNPLTWDVEVPDMGTMEAQRPGDKFPDGTTISDSDLATAGYLPYKHVTDQDGVPISGPIPFDGDGHPQKSPTPANIVWIKYRVIKNVRPFAPLQLDQ